jgi:hypothetical protein
LRTCARQKVPVINARTNQGTVQIKYPSFWEGDAALMIRQCLQSRQYYFESS